ncbi:MAG: cupin domain-containing protein, partial [Burkholderiaceae bacterium]
MRSKALYRLVDSYGARARRQEFWPSIIIPKEAIDAEVERLAEASRPANGRRGALVVHPFAKQPGMGLAPGIDVTINVLKPGETSDPIARNSTVVDMCIRGGGVAKIGAREFRVEQFDVWNTPSMEPYTYRNEGKDLFVRLSYSNTPLLEKLEVHYVDESPAIKGASASATASQPPAKRARDMAEALDLGTEGARLLGYEYLIDIDVVDSKPLLWPWKEVSKHLEKVYNRDIKYTGRHLYLLYNPATGRHMGT